MKKHATLAAIILALALGLRLLLAIQLPNEDDDDGRYYDQIAQNVLDGHGYSGESEAPFVPTLVRVPGYPLFLAGTYKALGRNSHGAVRALQAVADTITCLLVALLAGAWSPGEWQVERRRRAMIIAMALAAACPFTAIYVTTHLTESLAILLSTAFALAATVALRDGKVAMWCVAGLLGGAATMVRPDTALFVGGAGLTLLLVGSATNRSLRSTIARALVLTFCFAAVLAPWTIRNARVFGVLQPVAPLYANMPDEFAPRGYIKWLRTWVDDERYVSPFEDALDLGPIDVRALPQKAFDSPGERETVASLLDSYNHAPPEEPDDADEDSAGDTSGAIPDQPDSTEPPQLVRMTPQIDAGFAELARERISRRPLKYYLALPCRRAVSLWFDTHSQYYPFQGEIFPLYELDTDHHQQYWLSLFAIVTWLLTISAAAGVWVMFRSRPSRRWVLLLLLLIIPRMAFLSAQEHPEARYTVEFFPLVIAAGALSLALVRRQSKERRG